MHFHPSCAAQLAYLSAALDALPEQVAVLDADSVIIAVNAAWARVAIAHGGGVASQLGRRYLDLCHTAPGAEDAAAAAAIGAGIASVLRGGLPRFAHTYACDIAGTRLWFETLVTPLADGRGGLVLHRDVTSSKRASDSLTDRESLNRDHLDLQLRFANAINRMAAAIIGLDETQQILDTLATILGSTLGLDRCMIFDVDVPRGVAAALSEWLNQDCAEATSGKQDYPLALFPQSSRYMAETHRLLESHEDALDPRLAAEGSAPLLHGQLRIRSLLWYPFSFRADGFYMLIFNQISRRRAWRFEELGFLEAVANHVSLALQKSRILAARTRAEEQLRHAQKMEAIGRLAGGVSHDFNNLLTAITGYADLLYQRLPEGSTLRRHAESIIHSAERATATTRQLLAFSRRQVLQPKIVDLNATLSDLQLLLRRLIAENIELVTEPGANLGRVRIDPSQIELALVNLVVNARDAMPAGGRLTVATANLALDRDAAGRHGAAPGDYVRVQVSDTGSGMDEETLSHVFEPFFTTKDQGKGTGLGLSSVYGVVTAAGGHLDVVSKPGRGSIFSIFLPRVSAPTDAAKPATQAPTPHGDETVLVAEDEAMVRGLVCESLGELGYRVLAAGDGVEAVRLAAAHDGEIHLLLSDVVMPRMNGPALAEELCRARPRTRVLFMSGYAADAHAAIAASTASGFLAKPFTADELAKAVRTAIDQGRARIGKD